MNLFFFMAVSLVIGNFRVPESVGSTVVCDVFKEKTLGGQIFPRDKSSRKLGKLDGIDTKR